jgi:GT2 family glycosyltransferase
LWEELGGFDPDLPDYGNEIALCKRIVAKGYRAVWVRNSYIHHLGEQSYGGTIGAEGIVARIRAAELYTEHRHSKNS